MNKIKTKDDLIKELKKLEKNLAEYEKQFEELKVIHENLTNNYRLLEGEYSKLECVISKDEAERSRYRISMHHVACNLVKNKSDIPVHVILECLDADLIFVSMLVEELWTKKD